jgi:hypothetical protein
LEGVVEVVVRMIGLEGVKCRGYLAEGTLKGIIVVLRKLHEVGRIVDRKIGIAGDLHHDRELEGVLYFGMVGVVMVVGI